MSESLFLHCSEEPAYLNCGEEITKNTSLLRLHDINLCLNVLKQLHSEKNWYPEKDPFQVVIKIQDVQKRSIGEPRLIHELYILKEFHPQIEFSDLSEASSHPILIIVISAILVLVLITGVIVYFYKERSKRILQAIKSDNEKEFDVFISYSHWDKEFVEDYMVPNLEDEYSDIKYQCLLHERDFVPGLPILDQIYDAVKRSSCTMIILSSNFVESQWACQE